MQICTSPQTDNHTSIPPLKFFYKPDALPATQPTIPFHVAKSHVAESQVTESQIAKYQIA